MAEPRVVIQQASDGYPIHTAVWEAALPLRARVVVVHGVQSHGGWYRNLGSVLASAGFETHFVDRRGSGANQKDRGDTPSARRLIDDIAERLSSLRDQEPKLPNLLAAISWGGKTALVTAADHPQLVDGLALICPGFEPRVGVSARERFQIAVAYFLNRRKMFPIPLSDPSLFTGELNAQKFISEDPFSLRFATARLLASSTFIDRMVRSAYQRVKTPTLLMLAGKDRIVDNERTLASFSRLASANKRVIVYPDAHHTLEFEKDPERYALDLIHWAEEILSANPQATSSLHS